MKTVTKDDMSVLQLNELMKLLGSFEELAVEISVDQFAESHIKSHTKEMRRLVAVVLNTQWERSKSEPIRIM